MFLKRKPHRDRRRSKRYWLNTSVEILFGSISVDALGVNLSDRGMCLFAIANLPLGSRIEVEFLPSPSEAPVRSSAIVRHRALYLYGIEFLGESQPSEAVLSKHGPVPLPV
jgi:hypothetical protein